MYKLDLFGILHFFTPVRLSAALYRTRTIDCIVIVFRIYISNLINIKIIYYFY